ncbi:hypothetical protein [Neobacillus thermocopriae]|uniref:Uncharacterized protein n=1 Tax=Neobacillus thermocopriae TaxID=1215031 RepID=A0A6B3TRW9_9BACI|nr:hypothetical protein [Neobacillus thermocopriae]MED3622736.1 hypothetical protein [Neobacillus thermocopriae]MED3714172.1 hypothetical protein [Neobacillus thermocopriae]NEX78457.1 hypothetical protein [Neobacillus thermocopriae]
MNENMYMVPEQMPNDPPLNYGNNDYRVWGWGRPWGWRPYYYRPFFPYYPPFGFGFGFPFFYPFFI